MTFRLLCKSAVLASLLLVACWTARPSLAAFDSPDAAAEVASEAQVAASGGDADQADHGHGGHHGHDLVHANLSDSAEDPAEWRSDMAIASLIVFACLLTGLALVAWKPITEGLQKREKSIANSIENAERASKEAMEKLKQYETKLAEASTEAQRILADARKDAEAAGQRLLDAAQQEAADQRKRAVADIESAKAVALNELAEKSTDVAMTLASRIVGREVKAGDHQGMIQDMLSKLPSRN